MKIKEFIVDVVRRAMAAYAEKHPQRSDFKAIDTSISKNVTLTPLLDDTVPEYLDFKLTDTQGEAWRIVGLGKFELFNGQTRVHGVVTQQFSMDQQKTLRVYFKASGSLNREITRASITLLCAPR